MSPVSPARRRADAFSVLVEDASAGALRPTDPAPLRHRRDDDLLPLVAIVTSLRSTPAVQARPEFVADLRGRLMAAAEAALAPDAAPSLQVRRQPVPRRTGRERRLAAAIGGFALVSASASMSVAAQTALPGDTLYPLKRAIENVHENVLRSADDKGATMLDNASGRLDEVDRLSRAGGQDASVITATLQDFTDQAIEASGVLLTDFEETGRSSSIEELRDFAAASLAALDRLEAVVPIEARPSWVKAVEALDEIDQKARAACPACSDLPPAADPVATASDVGPLYQHLLDAVSTLTTTPVRPASSDPKEPTGSPSSGGGTTTPVEAPADPEGLEDPAQPSLPPSDGGGNQAPSPVDTVVTGADGTGLGDLLTGTGTAVDELVTGVGDGVTQPLP